MSLNSALANFIDFLFPKAEEVYALESLMPGELVVKLPPAADLGEDTLAVFAYYDPRVRELIWELKYRRNRLILESLAAVLYDVLRAELAERVLFENFSAPLLVPMAMSSARRLERGFNQTELLCEELKKLDTENIFGYSTDTLQKTLHTESQTLKENKKERLKNIEGSMQATEDAKGRNVILIDDVTTTGATFKEAQRALRHAGALKILSVALAH